MPRMRLLPARGAGFSTTSSSPSTHSMRAPVAAAAARIASSTEVSIGRLGALGSDRGGSMGSERGGVGGMRGSRGVARLRSAGLGVGATDTGTSSGAACRSGSGSGWAFGTTASTGFGSARSTGMGAGSAGLGSGAGGVGRKVSSLTAELTSRSISASGSSAEKSATGTGTGLELSRGAGGWTCIGSEGTRTDEPDPGVSTGGTGAAGWRLSVVPRPKTGGTPKASFSLRCAVCWACGGCGLAPESGAKLFSGRGRAEMDGAGVGIGAGAGAGVSASAESSAAMRSAMLSLLSDGRGAGRGGVGATGCAGPATAGSEGSLKLKLKSVPAEDGVSRGVGTTGAAGAGADSAPGMRTGRGVSAAGVVWRVSASRRASGSLCLVSAGLGVSAPARGRAPRQAFQPYPSAYPPP